MKWKAAIAVLEKCEQSLRKLVAEAAEEGDYGSVQRIAFLAKAISALVAESANASSPQRQQGDDGEASPPSAQRKQGRVRTDEYPKFFRRGDDLVKIGWSKKDRREYNHRAPRVVVTAVAAAIRQVGARGKVFNGDALLPLKDPVFGSTVPSYQVYVALAWLVRLGVVKQLGHRGGYLLNEAKPPEAIFTAAWPELPEWWG